MRLIFNVCIYICIFANNYTLFRNDHARHGFGYAGSRREESDAHYGIWYLQRVS